MRQIYEFGEFQADPAEQLLLHQGQPVALPPKVFETLLILLNGDGRLIDKSDFMDQLWPEVFVEDVALAQNISQLRKALSDGKDGTQMIQTVPKRGYRFTVPVRRVSVEEQQDEVKLSLQGRGHRFIAQVQSPNGFPSPDARSAIHVVEPHESEPSAVAFETPKPVGS